MPTLIYFPVAGRGALSRLIAAVGGVEDFQDTPLLPDGTTHATFGSPGTFPMMIDGDDFMINESGAIEVYLSMIAPAYKDLTPKQRAKDFQICQLKESYLKDFSGVIFDPSKDVETKTAEIVALADKWFPLLEGILPDDGFVNGGDYPTPGDLAVVNVCEGYMPFGAAFKMAGVDISSKYPKMVAHSDRAMAVEEVSAALETVASFKTPLPGF